jgi:hypothetical protein
MVANGAKCYLSGRENLQKFGFEASRFTPQKDVRSLQAKGAASGLRFRNLVTADRRGDHLYATT